MRTLQIILDMLGFIFMCMAPWLLLGMFLLIGLDSALANIEDTSAVASGPWRMGDSLILAGVLIGSVILWRRIGREIMGTEKRMERTNRAI